MALTKTKKLPKPAFVALPMDFPYKIRNAVPINPRIIPKTIRFCMRSFIIMAESVNTIIGVETIITAALMGEVRLNPLKKVSILNATPKKAAPIIRGKSLRAIFSFGIKSQISQNNSTEPPTRNRIKPYASMYKGMTSLAMVNVTP